MKLFRKLYERYREPLILLRQLVITDFKLRYQGSVLGYTWSLLRPLFMFAVLYVLFAVIFNAGRGIPNYPIYLLLGVMFWSFFGEMTGLSLGSIVERGDLIQKIRIPRWLIIVSASVNALINLTFNLIVVFGFALFYGMDFLSSSVFLPIFIVEVYLFALALSLILSALYVKYRDVRYAWDVVLQAGFYATPILYPIGLVTNEVAQKFLIINPVAQAIQGARNVFVTPTTSTIGDIFGSRLAVLIPLSIIFITLILGIRYFRKESKYFAENL